MVKHTACLLAVLAFSTASFAQDGGGSTVAGGLGRPLTLNIGSKSGSKNFIDFVMRRINTINIEERVREMKINGKTELQSMAGFGLDGALVYHHEIRGDDVDDYNDTGRNVGFQILPYTIRIAADGSTYVAINAVSFKNMIAAQAGSHPLMCDTYSGTKKAGFFEIVDQLDALVFKWDKGMSYNNINSFDIDWVSTNLKVDILNSPKKARVLAITAGGNLSSSALRVKLDDGEELKVENPSGDGGNLNFRAGYRGGLNYYDQGKKGGRINVSAVYSQEQSWGSFVDKDKKAAVGLKNDEKNLKFEGENTIYKADLAAYKTTKELYEKTNLIEKPLTDAEYLKKVTGVKVPVAPTKADDTKYENEEIKANKQYLNFGVEGSKQISGPTARPLRLGIGLNLNLPISDTMKGGKIDLDLKNQNRQLVNAKLFLNF